MRRRAFTASALAALAAPAVAQQWPAKPLRLVIPYPPGGPSDVSSRIVMDRAAQIIGQSILFDNKAGASGMIGAEFAKNQPVDHHTFLTTTTAMVCITRHLQPIPFDPDRDFVPVARMTTSWGAFAIHPSVPANTVAEFVAYAKANPGRINYGSAGLATITHLFGEMLSLEAGIRMTHVPYRGSAPATNALLAGEVQAQFDQTTLPHIKAGKLRALAMLAEVRSSRPATARTAAIPGSASWLPPVRLRTPSRGSTGPSPGRWPSPSWPPGSTLAACARPTSARPTSGPASTPRPRCSAPSSARATSSSPEGHFWTPALSRNRCPEIGPLESLGFPGISGQRLSRIADLSRNGVQKSVALQRRLRFADCNLRLWHRLERSLSCSHEHRPAFSQREGRPSHRPVAVRVCRQHPSVGHRVRVVRRPPRGSVPPCLGGPLALARWNRLRAGDHVRDTCGTRYRSDCRTLLAGCPDCFRFHGLVPAVVVAQGESRRLIHGAVNRRHRSGRPHTLA
jgi:tripartite-type tricarboxylate transporter receptor subunit TctC